MANIEIARRLIGACAAIAEADAALTATERAELQRAIEQILHALAVYLGPRYGAVAREPGYVACGPVLVPVHLVEDLPGAAELTEIAEIGLAVRVSVEATICLSGSVVLLRSLEYVGDLDFCEYAAYRDTLESSDVVAAVAAHARRPTLPICRQVKVMPRQAFSCDRGWDDELCEQLRRLIVGGERHLKLDFVARAASIGVVEATNIVLLLDDSRAATLAKSFAGQEVPIGAADAVLPRPIGDPIQLGRYINFLHQQVEAYLREDPLKALKRGLSLSRVMFLDDHGETIIELLRDEQGALAGAIAARAALLEELEGTECGDPVRRGVLDRLRSELEIMISRLRSHDRAGPHRPDWRGDVERALLGLMFDVKRLIARV